MGGGRGGDAACEFRGRGWPRGKRRKRRRRKRWREGGREGAPSGLCRISYCIIQWQVSYITYKWRGGGIMREGGAVKSQFYDIMRYPLRVEGRRGGGGCGGGGHGGSASVRLSVGPHGIHSLVWKNFRLLYILEASVSPAREALEEEKRRE